MPVRQGFRSPEEVETFGKLLEDMAHIVLSHKGSLKVRDRVLSCASASVTVGAGCS